MYAPYCIKYNFLSRVCASIFDDITKHVMVSFHANTIIFFVCDHPCCLRLEIWLHHNYIATSSAISLQHMQVKRLGIMELSSNLLDRRL